MTDEGLRAEDISIEDVLADYPDVAAAWIFGSLSRGSATPDSDIDIGILLRERRDTAREHYMWLSDLANRVEQRYDRAVDIVVLGSQGAVFCHRVLREGRLIYEADPERRIDFESTVYSRYFDFRPTWEIAARVSEQGFVEWLNKQQ